MFVGLVSVCWASQCLLDWSVFVGLVSFVRLVSVCWTSQCLLG